MPLTDVTIRNAKPSEKPVRLFDGSGLYVEIAVTGGKLWRLKYRFGGKEKRLALGVYADVGLKDARVRRDEARKLLANGVDPAVNRKAQQAARMEWSANTFEVLCREWLEKRKDTVEPAQHVKTLARMENDVFPWLGAKAIPRLQRPISSACYAELTSAERATQRIGCVAKSAVHSGTQSPPDALNAIPART